MKEFWVFTSIIILVLVGAFIGLFYCSSKFSEECNAKGGHAVHVYKSSLCVSKDGRILE